MDNFLTTLILLPLIYAVIIPLLPVQGKGIHTVGILGALSLFIYSLMPYLGGQLPASIQHAWMPSLGISYALGADGLSLSLVVLATFLLLMSCIASVSSIHQRLKFYYSMLFVLTASVIGVFTARDLFLYFLFWELELIPMYFLIAIWGGPRRQYASMKFILYTLFGSVFLVGALVLLYSVMHQLHGVTPSTVFLYDSVQAAVKSGGIAVGTQLLLFVALFITFAVKLPMVPFHTWLPDAHVEAPTPVSMMLAGIMLKMGAYGMIRLCFGFFPESAAQLSPYIALLAVINIVYTAGVALAQSDMKKLIAYSSVSHMGFVLLGLAALNPIGFSGATFVLISHGIVSAALFMCIGTLYVRTHTRDIVAYGGFGIAQPTLFYFFLLFSMASLGLPLLISFAGESLVFYGAYLSQAFTHISLFDQQLPWSIQHLTAFSAIGVILGAAYSLWLVKRLFYGPQKSEWANLPDATPSELLVLSSLAVCTIVFGFFPNLITRSYQDSIQALSTAYHSGFQTTGLPLAPTVFPHSNATRLAIKGLPQHD